MHRKKNEWKIALAGGATCDCSEGEWYWEIPWSFFYEKLCNKSSAYLLGYEFLQLEYK